MFIAANKRSVSEGVLLLFKDFDFVDDIYVKFHWYFPHFYGCVSKGDVGHQTLQFIGLCLVSWFKPQDLY